MTQAQAQTAAPAVIPGLSSADLGRELAILGYDPELARIAAHQAVRYGEFTLRLHVIAYAPGTGMFRLLDRRLAGPGVLIATVHGDSIAGMREAALAAARRLYGEDAPLQVTRIGTMRTSITGRGEFTTEITVQCTELPEGWETA